MLRSLITLCALLHYSPVVFGARRILSHAGSTGLNNDALQRCGLVFSRLQKLLKKPKKMKKDFPNLGVVQPAVESIIVGLLNGSVKLSEAGSKVESGLADVGATFEEVGKYRKFFTGTRNPSTGAFESVTARLWTTDKKAVKLKDDPNFPSGTVEDVDARDAEKIGAPMDRFKMAAIREAGEELLLKQGVNLLTIVENDDVKHVGIPKVARLEKWPQVTADDLHALLEWSRSVQKATNNLKDFDDDGVDVPPALKKLMKSLWENFAEKDEMVFDIPLRITFDMFKEKLEGTGPLEAADLTAGMGS